MLKDYATMIRLAVSRLTLLSAIAAVSTAVAIAEAPARTPARSCSDDQRYGDESVNPATEQGHPKDSPAPLAAKVNERDRPSPLATEKEIEGFDRSTWRIGVKLDAPGLMPPAVQIAVLDKDPLPGFRARLTTETALSLHRQQIARAKNESEKERHCSMEMSAYWDMGFKEVTGDHLYLLTSANIFDFSSRRPDGKHWIATKIVNIKGRPACWCLPIEVRKGKRGEVALTEANLFDLSAAFGTAMREAAAEAPKATMEGGEGH
jgi:hypothetical protein